MASSQQNTAGSLAKTDDMARSRGRQDTVLADEELLDTVGGTNFGNQLNDLRVPVATIATDDEEGSCKGLVVSSDRG